MLAETRRRQLLDHVNRRGFATLDELVKSLGVSESTIRRDLEALDLAGVVKRTHGGAVCSSDVRAMPAFEERETAQAAEKRAIGAAAAAHVADGDTILLDGGTTTLEVARALAGRPLQVVTNSLPIAMLLAATKDTDLILIGGYVYPRTGVAMGPLAVQSLQGIRVHKLFMGAGGIMPEGVFNSNSLLVETERQMMQCAQEIVLVADRTKFGRLALSRLCGLDEIHTLIVDSGLGERDQELMARHGVSVHLASLAASPERDPAASGSLVQSPARIVS
jgi:DeoR/GlpR family transcriptional regulator of sugar metabolism